MFTDSNTEKFLVTSETNSLDGKLCKGIMFTGDIGHVKSYFTADEYSIKAQKADVKPGDIILIDGQNNMVGYETFQSASIDKRLSNILDVFQSLKACAQERTPRYFNQEKETKEQERYVWQYLKAAGSINFALMNINSERRDDEKTVKSVLESKIIRDIRVSLHGLNGKDDKKDDHIKLENQIKALKILHGADKKDFKFSSFAFSLCDDLHNDYLLITGDNKNDNTVSGLLLSNFLDKEDGKSSLTYVSSIPFEGNSALLGDFVGIEHNEEGKLAVKPDGRPLSMIERIQNFYFANNLLFEKYVQNDGKQFNSAVYSSQLYITRGLSRVLFDYSLYNCEDKTIDDNKSLVYDVIARSLNDDYLNGKDMGHVRTICDMNEAVNSTNPIINLPKRVFGEKIGEKKAQTTLDMF